MGFKNLGQLAILVVYLSCALFTPLSTYVVKRFGYKTSMLVCSIGYLSFSSAGLVVILGADIPKALVWIIIGLGAMICGMSCSVIWVAQGGYISTLAGK